MTDRQTVRIFISSPADVMPERLIAERVIQRLGREFAYHFTLEAVSWNREPLRASAGFQEQIVRPRETDIVLVVVWSRLGMPLDVAKFPGPLSGGEVTGTEWEFEDALASARERRLPDLLLYRKTAAVTAELGTDSATKARQQESQRQLELVEAFMQRWTRDAEGKAFTAASWSFADGAAFEALVEEQLRKLLRERLRGSAETATVRWHEGSPYRGLEGFGPEHEQIFFGRTRARNELRELLLRQIARGSAFVLVMGASGSGKSSLVKAGLLPEIGQPGMIGRSGLVRRAIVRPGGGSEPLAGLAAALLSDTALPELARPPLGYTAERLATLLARPGEAAEPVRQGLQVAGAAAMLTDPGSARLLLVVDQLEELFTDEAIGPQARADYVAALQALAASGAVWIVATMRSDFFPRLAELPALAALAAGEARYLLTPPDAAEFGQIVRQPAREAGLRFETDEARGARLDDEIVEAASGDPASLPLLEYLLDQLWRQRDTGGMLGFAAYRALGGLEGAIGQRAEAVLAAQPAAVQAALPRLLRALVTVGAGTHGVATARLAPLDELAPGSGERRLAEALLAPDARLLTADHGNLRVAHEALLRHWPRAQAQIAEDRVDLQLRARLEEAASRWRDALAADRDSLLLPRGRPLSEAEDLVQRRSAELAPEVRDFVGRSGAAARDVQRRTLRRWQMAVAGFAVLSLAAAGGAWFGLAGQREAEAQAARAQDQARRAEEQTARAEEQTKRTAEQTARAEANLDEALGLVDALLVDVVAGHESLGMKRADARRILDRVERSVGALSREGASPQVLARRVRLALSLVDIHLAMGDLPKAAAAAGTARELAQAGAAAHPGSTEWQRDLALALDKSGTVRREQADLAGALAAYRQMLEIRLQLAARQPDSAEWQRALSIGHSRVGNVLQAQGDLAGALLAYRQDLEIVRRLVASDAANRGWQRDLSVSLDTLGDALQEQGDLAAALAAYREALAIRQRLTGEVAANTVWQRDLAISHHKLAEVARAQGDVAGALAAYRQALAVRERLAAQDRGNTVWQRDVAVTHNVIGEVLALQGDFPGALAEYRRALAIGERLAALDPDNSEWQRDLSLSHERLGLILRVQGDLGAALAAYRQSHDIHRQLVARDSGNALWQRDLSVSCNGIGDVLAVQGDLAGALASYREGLAIRERLAAADAANSGWQRDLAVSHDKIGDVLKAQGQIAAAYGAFRQAQTIRQALTQKDAANATWLRDLSLSLNRIGDLLLQIGDHDGALAIYRQDLEIAQRLAAKDSGNAEAQRDLAISHLRLGDVLRQKADLAGAEAAFRQTMQIVAALAARDAGNTEWQRDLTVVHERIGDILRARGDLAGALGAAREGLAIRERLAARDADNAEWQRDLAVAQAQISLVLEAMQDRAAALAALDKAAAINARLRARWPDHPQFRADEQWIAKRRQALGAP